MSQQENLKVIRANLEVWNANNAEMNSPPSRGSVWLMQNADGSPRCSERTPPETDESVRWWLSNPYNVRARRPPG